ncbi:4-aminobutyrate aminotransferase [Pandoraea pnomenusa]|uniref:4-aminobutyrate aminotransferase PuuE n=1 Tax=Pandoraea pnomenusa TaxID=93220 RepID=A0A378YW93_9BURK|nr:4-aminobutyrate--2-oxoglutarate transaminase [Pandoraea pnomenusa]AIU28831.1 4-aminobutyrate aminotransferase [Pandoraea pnomenusa]SUA81412.1 4-aminobutyrate aminotransferase PuuE [Pandoraea pnomenusa]
MLNSARSNASLQARKDAACAKGIGVMTQHFTARAWNAEIWDVQGNRFIDFAGGIAVLATGHRHPRIVAAVQAQLEQFHHTCFHVTPYEGYVALCERLNDITPGKFAKKTALFTTGAEAVENAIKVARAATGRSAIIAFSGAFHGRTMMGMALTGKVAPYKQGFGPMPAEVFHAPYPVALHGVSVDDSIAAIESLFKTDVDPRRVAAIFIELVQGEGGFYVAPPAFVTSLRALCDKHGILLVVDEVQTGFARTGKPFALSHHDVDADLVTMAKSLAGGFPLSALTGRAELMDAAGPGGIGGTYAGNPLACAAALAAIDVIEEEGLAERASVLGDQLTCVLAGLRAEVPGIVDVRGLGAMIAVEFGDAGTGAPDADMTRRVQAEALRRGLLLLICGVHANVIRFLFPLTIEDEVFAEGLAVLVESIRSARAA